MKKPINTLEKEPVEELDYRFNFSAWLVKGTPNDTIATYTIAISGGNSTLVKELDVRDTPQSVLVWLSGGTAGTDYTITCTVHTASSPPRVGIEHFVLRVI